LIRIRGEYRFDAIEPDLGVSLRPMMQRREDIAPSRGNV